MKTYDINEAADFLKVDRTTALDLAGRGELPGAKVGRAWVFMEVDLVEYLRDMVRLQTNRRREQSIATQSDSPTTAASTGVPRRGRRRPVPSLSGI